MGYDTKSNKKYGIGKKLTSLGAGLFMFFMTPEYVKDKFYNVDFFYRSLPMNQIKSTYYSGAMSDGQFMDLFDGFKERFNDPEAGRVLDKIRDETILNKKTLEVLRKKYEKTPAPRVEKSYKITGTLSSVKRPHED